jgi:4-amino-4-deoxy-L-arabinose transferase-like glycosyltransferase
LPDAHRPGTILGLVTWNPWAFLVAGVAGWMNRPPQDVMAYLAEENGLLWDRPGHKRISRIAAQKRRLRVAGNEADRDLLQ